MFFPPMFGEESKTNNGHEEEKEMDSAHSKYLVLKSDYIKFRAKSKNVYDFYNIVEKSVLEMEGEESNRISEELLKDNGMKREDLQKIV